MAEKDKSINKLESELAEKDKPLKEKAAALAKMEELIA